MKNTRVVRIFRDIADILEIRGENVFRIRAYQRAASIIDGLPEDVEELVNKDGLGDIPGIGKDLEAKIREIVSTGTCAAYEELKGMVPQGLLELTKIPTVGPKTARMLHEKLGIGSLAGLRRALEDGTFKGVRGIGEKTVQNIRRGISLLEREKDRMPLAVAAELSGKFTGRLGRLKEVRAVSEAGSLRRRKETVRDIDILVASPDPGKVMDAFTGLTGIKEVVARGETKASVRTEEDVQVDCRVVEEKSFGAALVYFTGSKNFNIRLRSMAVKKGWKVNEYGVFEAKSPAKGEGKFLAGRSEEEIFDLFGMEYIPPELREDSGEIDLARERRLPRLVTLERIKGDLHCHSTWSDGGNTIREMAAKAASLGYSYLAVTDHSQGLKIARGLDPAALRKKKKEIDTINKGLRGLRILFGSEVDIGPEGGMDYPDEVLKEFDIVVGALHSGFAQSRAQLTRRLTAACANRHVHIIAHPTGRLWGAREAYDIDMKEVLRACRDTNTSLEINAFPNRLDLNDQNCRLAREAGVRLAVNTDSHALAHLDNMRLGIYVARRGWLEAKDIINTLPLEELLKSIRKHP